MTPPLPLSLQIIFGLLLLLLTVSAVTLMAAFARDERWLHRLVVVDTLSIVTACAIAVLAALHDDPHLLDAALLVAMVALFGTTAALHFMPTRKEDQ